jgi:hypothetical protein
VLAYGIAGLGTMFLGLVGQLILPDYGRIEFYSTILLEVIRSS